MSTATWAPPRNTFEPFVSADAVACYVGIERGQVMQLTRAGKLPAYPIDPEAKRKAWRYKLSEVDAMISGSPKAVGELAAAFGSRDNKKCQAQFSERFLPNWSTDATGKSGMRKNGCQYG